MSDYSSALHEAAFAGHLPCVELLHTAFSNGINTRNRQRGKWMYTPLMCAALRNHADIVRYLLRSGADQGVVTADGETALFLAVSRGHIASVLALISDDGTGAYSDVNKSHAMDYALRCRSRCAAECVPILLTQGTHLSHKNYVLLRLEAERGHEKEFQAFMYPRLSIDVFAMIECLRGSNTADVMIQVEDQSFQAHRWLLSARCEMFAVMLDQRMQERLSGVVRITGHSASTVDLFLRYVYSVEPDFLGQVTTEELCGLLLFANEYLCMRLQRICEHHLGSRMQGAADQKNITQLADVLDLPVLSCYIKRATTSHTGDGVIASQLNHGTGTVFCLLCLHDDRSPSVDFALSLVRRIRLLVGKHYCAMD